jgi:Ca-activated chloride channel family protein
MTNLFHRLSRGLAAIAILALISLTTVPALKANKKILPPEPWPKPTPQPRPSGAYAVDKLEILIKIDGQMATFAHRATIRNTGRANLEMDYLVPLPTDSAISGVTLLADGQELVGRLYPKSEALDIYRQIVARLKDPALMEYSGLGLYRARIFPLPPGKTRTLELTASYLLTKDQGLIKLDFPVAGPLTVGQTIGEQLIQVKLINVKELASLYSPLAEVKIERDASEATAVYAAKSQPALDNFALRAQEGQEAVGSLILSHKPQDNEDGFFLFLAEPAINQKNQVVERSKNVIFALDTSGSMEGVKFTQAQDALKFVLERLKPIDTFNLVSFSSDAEIWRPQSSPMSEDNRQAALKHLSNLRAHNSTNIEKALKLSLDISASTPSYVLFLSDGEPTTGQTGEMELSQLAKSANTRQARIFSFGVGNQVNARLLDRLSGQAGGVTVYVKNTDNIEAKVAEFFSKLTNPVLTNPTLNVNIPTNRLIPQNPPDIFQNSQIVVVGRYPQGGAATFKLSGRIGDEKKEFVYQVELAKGPDPRGEFVQLLWAQRRVGEIIDQIDLAGDNKPPNPELVEELVNLSKKYGLMTPYTSFLALEKTDLTNRGANVQTATQNLRVIEEVVGQSANTQRTYKQQFKANAAPMSAVPKSATLEKEMAALDQEVAKKDAGEELNAPQRLAGKTFFQKNGQLVDEVLTAEDLKNAVPIEPFSDQYFELASILPAEARVWISQSKPTVFKNNHKVYLIKSSS